MSVIRLLTAIPFQDQVLLFVVDSTDRVWVRSGAHGDVGWLVWGTWHDLGSLPNLREPEGRPPVEEAGPTESGAGSPPRPLLGSGFLGHKKIEGAADYRPPDPSRRNPPAESP